jgi:hypothetical protein
LEALSMQVDLNIPANASGIALTIVAGTALLALPRRYAIIPVIATCCYMTMGQSIVIADCHFTMIRLLMLFGWARVLLRGELRTLELSRLDKAIVWWTAISFIAYVCLWRSGEAFIYKAGATYNIIGYYFLFRMMLQNLDDVIQVCRTIALLTVPLAICILLEKSTGRNVFAVFGGVNEITLIRDGVLRCQGPFSHPILAGTFGATVLPLAACLWLYGGMSRLMAAGGVISSSIITVASGSSGPVLAFMAAVLALSLWRARTHMYILRRGVAGSLIFLQIFMKAPIWFLLARVDVFSGSTGFHRAMLIDGAFRNLSDWWLLGTKSTLSWADEEQGLFDVTNQYLLVGAEGGIVSMGLFIWIIVCAFRLVGLTWRSMNNIEEPLANQFAVWALGAALFAHVVSYISVSYFDQNFVNWYLLLAMIATVGDQFFTTNSIDETASVIGTDEHEQDLAEVGPSTWLMPLKSVQPRLWY